MTAGEFLRDTLECFERAAARAELRERTVSIAGVPVTFRVAGDRVAEALLPGLWQGLRDSRQAPRVTLAAFDSAEGGEVPPSPPWSMEDLEQREGIRGFSEGRWRAAYFVESSSLWFHDLETGTGVCWARDAGDLDRYERSRPWRTGLHWAMPPFARYLVHAAGVGEVLVVGIGGSGKSTTAVAAAAAGLPCVGDDYVVLFDGDSGWTAHMIYPRGKLHQESLAMLGLEPAARDAWGKGEVELANPAESMPVRAIVVPRVADRTGRPQPVSPAVALRYLAPSTLIQAPGHDPELITVLGRLVRAVPAVSLEVGSDLEAIPAAIEEAAAAGAAA